MRRTSRRLPPAVLLRTDWPKRAWRTPDFWAESPYITEDAAWLAEQGIEIIGYDFPQEYPIREIAERQTDGRFHGSYRVSSRVASGSWSI